MSHPLVKQFQFARQSWERGLAGVSDEEARERIGHTNSISWTIGHLAEFEQAVWLERMQGQTVSEAVKICAFGEPASTPPLAEMVDAWQQITAAVDDYLNKLTADQISEEHPVLGQQNIGTMLLRQTWHYWYHLGEVQAIRQALGHTDLPQYVGSMPAEAHHAKNAAKDLVARMYDGLNDHVIEGMEAFWTEDMHWYGPTGIGTKPSLKAFQEEHQKPFLHAFSDKHATDEIRIAEDNYVAAKGFQQVTHTGDYLGIPASGKRMKIRYMDIWRAEGDKLVENWVMIDLLDFLEQVGYDVEKVLKFIGSKPPEFFDEVEED